MSWNKLSMYDRAAYIKLGINNGITDLNTIREIYNKFEEGGPLSERDKVLNKANTVASNYNSARDFNMNPVIYGIRKTLEDVFGRGGLSNCTLSATQWVNPNNSYMSAKNIVNNPNTGYREISKDEAIPGDLLISKNPNTGTYHTMLIEGLDENNNPILRYSRGGHSTEDNLVVGKRLADYHTLDVATGGNHTEDYYFRSQYPDEINLHTAVVTAYKKNKRKGPTTFK